MTTPNSVPAAPAATAAPAERTAAVLAVDDRIENLQVLDLLLSGPGRTIVKASSGQEALRLALQRDFCVILLDLRMPEMDGIETAKYLRKSTRTRHTPIIFVTAVDTTAEEVTRAYSAGAVDFIFKPCPPEVLKAKVAAFIELHRQKEALAESEERFRLMVDGMQTAAITLLDPEGKVVSWNPGAERLFGLPAEEILGRSLSITYEENEAREKIFRETLEAARSGGKSTSDHRRLRKDGSRFWGATAVTALMHPSGGLRGYSVVVQDVTERKRVEEELLRSNEQLEQFAYVASHDLQEPLRAVAGCVQLLEQRYRDALDDRARQYIGHAVSGVGRMQTLIDDLLTYSRVGTRAKPLAPTDSAEVVRIVLEDLAVAIQEAEAKVTVHGLPVVWADASQLRQVFQNLVANAVKFRRSKPEIRITAERGEDGWVFRVKDNGIGIDPKYFDRLFVVFQRLHTLREYPGNGLGLALCKRIIERHGGRIGVASVPGEGSVFHFTLPDRRDAP